MKHATPAALDTIEGLLAQIRELPGVVEKKRGTFYRGSTAFLHFHEDPAGMFADVKCAGEWVRLPVNSAAEKATLLRRARELLG